MRFPSIVIAVAFAAGAVAAWADVPTSGIEARSGHELKWPEISDMSLLSIGIAGLVAGRQSIRKRRG